MRVILMVLFLGFLTINSYAQEAIGMNPLERAYLFHVVKKSPILDNSIGRYFEYTGPDIRFLNGNINYDSIETYIINTPEYLIIREQEIAKSSKGILAEAANKVAIWDLNKMLLAKRQNDPTFDNYATKYAVLESILLQKLPLAALDENGTKVHPRVNNLLNPSLSFEDKLAQMNVFKGADIQTQLLILTALAEATNEYVELRTKELYKSLGGQYETFHNWLIAVGDGSSTSGLLDEREKDEKGRWNRGLPKAIGLFPYQLYIQEPEKKKQEPKIMPRWYIERDFNTNGENRMTQIHFDVWGYNSAKQTTVVLEKAGRHYHLFGSVDTRFLSPDSSFSSGATFMGVINEIQHKYIDDITEKIVGKRGYDYWIEHYKVKKEETELKIEKSSKQLSDKGYTPVVTAKKPSKEVKKAKANAVKASVGADNWKGDPTTYDNKKQKSKNQSEIMYLYERFDWYKAKIKELEKEKKEAIELREKFEHQRDLYKRVMGMNWMNFTVKDGLYTFSDSSTFDIYTQDFTFPATAEPEHFEIRLIGVPNSAISKNVDEVMMHASIIDAKPKYDARIQVNLTDLFESNQFELTSPLFSAEDSVAVLHLFEQLLDKENDFKVIGRGNGAGEWNGVRVIASSKEEQTAYSEVGKWDESYSKLRLSEVLITLNRGILLEVNSYTDPVRSKFDKASPEVVSIKNQFKLTDNQVLSAYRSASILRKLKQELNVLAGQYLTREQAKIVIDKLNKTIDKSKITMGPISVKLSDF